MESIHFLYIFVEILSLNLYVSQVGKDLLFLCPYSFPKLLNNLKNQQQEGVCEREIENSIYALFIHLHLLIHQDCHVDDRIFFL